LALGPKSLALGSKSLALALALALALSLKSLLTLLKICRQNENY